MLIPLWLSVYCFTYSIDKATSLIWSALTHIDLISARGAALPKRLRHRAHQQGRLHVLLAVVAPNLLCKPATVMFNKVTIKGAKQAVQMFGPAQRGVAMAVADSVEDGTIPAAEADNIFVQAGVFIHWMAEDDKKIQDYNYQGHPRSHQARGCR